MQKLVIMCLDLEGEAAEGLLFGVNHAGGGGSRAGRGGGEFDKGVEQFAHAEVVDGAAEKDRRLRRLEIVLVFEGVGRAVEQFDVLPQLVGGIVAEQLFELRVGEVLDSDAVFWACVLAGGEQGDLPAVQVVDALEALAHADGGRLVGQQDRWPVDRRAIARRCCSPPERAIGRGGMKMNHVRIGKEVRVSDALMFLAGDRETLDEAYAGDIIGTHNHGTIQIGDSFTSGENLNFTGIPHFAPELFRRVVLKDPLKSKQLQKGLQQLSKKAQPKYLCHKSIMI